MILSWSTAFDLFLFFLSTQFLFAVECVLGQFSDVETTSSLKDFFNGFGSSSLNYENSLEIFSDFRYYFLLNTTIVSLESATIVLLLGTNLRHELPLLNSRLRKNYLFTNKQLSVYSVGLSFTYLTFPVKNLGNSLFSVVNIFVGKSIILKDISFKDFVNSSFLNFETSIYLLPKIFIGVSLLNRTDGISILNSAFYFINKKFKNISFSNCLSIVSPFLGRISVAEVGSFTINKAFGVVNAFSFFYFCGVNDFYDLPLNSFVVYQGFFKSNTFLFNKANLIFPATNFFERNSIYLNIEGRLRCVNKVIIPFKFLFSDQDIVKGLTIFKKKIIAHNFSVLKNFNVLNFFKRLINYKCLFVLEINYIAYSLAALLNLTLVSGLRKKNFSFGFFDNLLYNTLINRVINNYYSSDMFSRNSKIMSICATKVLSNNFYI